MALKQSQIKVFHWIYAINVFGNSLTWTGLPMLLVAMSKNPQKMTDLFILHVFSSLSVLLVGGFVSDRFDRKKTSFVLGLLSFLTMSLVYGLTQVQNFEWLYLAVGLAFVCSALLECVLNTWFMSSVDKNSLESESAKRSSIVIFSKLIGMAVGPIVFNSIGAFAILLDALSFAICVGVIFLIMPKSLPFIPVKQVNLIESLKSYFQELIMYFKSREFPTSLMMGVAASGLLAFPMVTWVLSGFSQKLFVVYNEMPSLWSSAFWTTGAVSTLVASLLFKRSLKGFIGKQRMLKFSFVAFLVAIYVVYWQFSLTDQFSPMMLVSAFSVLVFANPISNIVLNTKIFSMAPQNLKGGANSFQTVVFEISILMGLGLVKILAPWSAIAIVAIFVAAFTLRTIVCLRSN